MSPQHHRTIEKLEKQHFICSNLTLFIVPFFLFFSFFFFSLGGEGPQMTPLRLTYLPIYMYYSCQLHGCVALCYDGFSEKSKLGNVELCSASITWMGDRDGGPSHSGANFNEHPQNRYRMTPGVRHKRYNCVRCSRLQQSKDRDPMPTLYRYSPGPTLRYTYKIGRTEFPYIRTDGVELAP